MNCAALCCSSHPCQFYRGFYTFTDRACHYHQLFGCHSQNMAMAITHTHTHSHSSTHADSDMYTSCSNLICVTLDRCPCSVTERGWASIRGTSLCSWTTSRPSGPPSSPWCPASSTASTTRWAPRPRPRPRHQNPQPAGQPGSHLSSGEDGSARHYVSQEKMNNGHKRVNVRVNAASSLRY